MTWALLAFSAAASQAGCPVDITKLCTSRANGICHVDSNVTVAEPPYSQLVVQCEWVGDPGESVIIGEGITVSCLSPAYELEEGACSLALSFDGGITLRRGAPLMAGTVNLNTAGRLIVDSLAHISADGMGRCGYQDASSAIYWSGAAHGGAGGDCTGSHHSKGGEPFGDATMPYDAWVDRHDPYRCRCRSYGSGTSFDDIVGPSGKNQVCCGGGMVLVNASAGLQLDGLISADAQRPCRKCHMSANGTTDDGTPGNGAAGGGGLPWDVVLPCCESWRGSYPCDGLGGASGGTVVVKLDGFVPLNGSGFVKARGGDGTVRTSDLDPTAAEMAERSGSRRWPRLWANALTRQQKPTPTSGGGGGRVYMSVCPTTVDVDVSGGLPSALLPGQECTVRKRFLPTRALTTHRITPAQPVSRRGRVPSHLLSCTQGGGAGSAFYETCGDGGASQLNLDNKQHSTGVASTISDGQPHLPVAELLISNGALLRPSKQQNVTASYRIVLKSDAQLDLACGQHVVSPSLQVPANEGAQVPPRDSHRVTVTTPRDGRRLDGAIAFVVADVPPPTRRSKHRPWSGRQ